MKYLFIILLSTFFFASCKKDVPDKPKICEECIEGSECTNEIPSGSLVCPPSWPDVCDYRSLYDTLRIRDIMFNPSNANEIGVVSFDYYGNDISNISQCCFKFKVYNHKTNTNILEYVFPEPVRPKSAVEWSVNNELIYSDHSNNVRIMNLTTMENEIVLSGKNPIWNFHGDTFVFARSNMLNPIRASHNGEIFDTLNFEVQHKVFDWSESNKLLYDSKYYDIENDSVHSIWTFPWPISNIKKWGVDDTDIFVISNGNGGLYRKDTEWLGFLIDENCVVKTYSNISISRDKQYLAAKLSIFDFYSGDTLLDRNEVRVMQLDASEQCVLQMD